MTTPPPLSRKLALQVLAAGVRVHARDATRVCEGVRPAWSCMARTEASDVSMSHPERPDPIPNGHGPRSRKRRFIANGNSPDSQFGHCLLDLVAMAGHDPGASTLSHPAVSARIPHRTTAAADGRPSPAPSAPPPTVVERNQSIQESIAASAYVNLGPP